MSKRDYYEVLEVSKSASLDEMHAMIALVMLRLRKVVAEEVFRPVISQDLRISSEISSDRSSVVPWAAMLVAALAAVPETISGMISMLPSRRQRLAVRRKSPWPGARGVRGVRGVALQRGLGVSGARNAKEQVRYVCSRGFLP